MKFIKSNNNNFSGGTGGSRKGKSSNDGNFLRARSSEDPQLYVEGKNLKGTTQKNKKQHKKVHKLQVNYQIRILIKSFQKKLPLR